MSKRILIVEDERIVAEDIAQCLEDHGYEIIGFANNGDAAVALTEEHRPDLVLMDIVIQGDKDGVETAAILNERFGISVVYLTAYSHENVLSRAKKTDPLGYVVKPFDEASLLSTVEIALHKQSLYQQLVAGREWFYTTLHSVGDGVVATDTNGAVVFMNPTAEELTGWIMAEAEGQEVERVFHIVDEQSQEAAPNPAREALVYQDAVDSADNALLVSRDRSTRHVETSGTLIRNADGAIMGAVLVFRDISDKKAKAKQLLKYQKHLEELVDERTAALSNRIEMEGLVSSICVALTKYDPELLDEGIEGALTKISKFLEVDYFCITGPPGETILQSRGHNLPEGEERIQTFFQDLYWKPGSWANDQLIHHGHAVIRTRDEVKMKDPDLAESLQSLGLDAFLGMPLGDNSSAQPWAMITFSSRKALAFNLHDIRILVLLSEIIYNLLQRRENEKERLALMESLNQSQKLEAIGKLSGGIAHDFNNMLVPIIGYSDVILQNQEFGFEHRKELMEIRKAAESAASLTKQLLAFSRKQILQKDKLNLNESIEHMRNMLQRILGEDVVLKQDLATDLWGIEADRGQLEQVIMNLCVNARHAMPDGGEIRIHTENVRLTSNSQDEPSGAFVKIAVEDQGCGMSKELLEHIFEPFYTTKGQDGTGLGLSVVLGIVDQHGGWINVESELGKGTKFIIHLPSDGQPCGSEVEATESTGALRAKKGCERILLIEDEPSVLAFVTQALKKAGFQVTTAASAKAAIRTYEEHRGEFDMIFTDAVLPDGTGMEILEDLLERDPGLMALLSSGYTDARALLDKALERDIPFLHKPYSLAELYEKLKEVIHHTREASVHEEPSRAVLG